MLSSLSGLKRSVLAMGVIASFLLGDVVQAQVTAGDKATSVLGDAGKNKSAPTRGKHQEDGQKDNATQLQQVTVTAEHREESSQVVPISMVSVTAKQIQDSGYQSVTDLQYMVPGLQYDPTQGSAFQIRGVGSESFDFSNEKSVSVVVDDVVMDGQRDNGLIGLSDLERVDVLMGPQGTIAGKNATSGAILITTANPDLDGNSGTVSVNYGERGDRIINGVLNIPISSNAAVRIAAFDQAQDGTGKYTTLNQTLGSFHDYGYRAKLLYQPSDKFQMILASDYENHRDNTIRTPVSGASPFITSQEIANGVTPGPRNMSTADSSEGIIKSAEQGESLHLKYSVGDSTLTSITAYRTTKYDNTTPVDLLPDTVFSYIPFNYGALKSSKFSQELRWASATGQFFEYLGGLFYDRLSADQSQLQWGTLGAPLISNGVPVTQLYSLSGAIGRGNTSVFNSHNNSEAIYGQVKLNFTDAFSLTVGGRETFDQNSQSESFDYTSPLAITGRQYTFIPLYSTPFLPKGEVVGHNFSYRVSPQYKLSDSSMVYLTYSTGYKPAGVAFVSNNYDPYKAETVKSLELGEKSEFFDHRLRLNFDLFDEKFTNFQASTLTSIPGTQLQQTVIGNAGGLTSKGAETSLNWQVSPSWLLNMAATYADTKFTNYVYNKTTDYSNTILSNAPRLSGTIGGDYHHALGSDLTLTGSFGYSIRSKAYTVVGDPAYSKVAGFGLMNARVGVVEKHTGIEAGLYVRNMFNKYFSTGFQNYGSVGIVHYTTLDAFRTVGAYLSYSF